MSRLVIIDSHAIVHRAYHSIPRLTHNGQVVNAVYGFYSMLLSAAVQLKPKYLVVCSDSPGPNFRNAEFIGYRAKRKPADRDLISQFPLIDASLNQSHTPVFAVGGYEADDLIATIARQALIKRSKESQKKLITEVIIITGDKDLMQLVSPQVKLFVPIRGLSETKLYDENGVIEKLGVRPDQVVDLKALIGDSSDNYPGIPGIGPKTAVDLLAKYHNLDAIYEHTDEITGTAKAKIIASKEDAYLSQKLAQLVDDIPLVKLKLKASHWNQARVANFLPIFDNFGFRSLSARAAKQFGLAKPKSAKIIDTNQGSLF